jgi:hypothetical protein
MKVTRRSALEMLGAALCSESIGDLFPRGLLAEAGSGAADVSMDCYDLVWTSPSRNAGESMPCGGGDIGLNVWVEDGDVLCYLSRSGSFDELNSFPKFGRMRIRLTPNPFVAGAIFRQRLRLEQGCVEITGETEGLHVTLRVWVDVHAPVVHFETESDAAIAEEVAFESWRLTERGDLPGEVATHRSYDGAPRKAVHTPDEVAFGGNDVVAVHHNGELFSDFDLCVEQQGLNAVKDRMMNPLKNLCFGTLVRGDGFVAAGTGSGRYASTDFKAWALRSEAPAKRHEVRAYLHIDTVPSKQAWMEGVRRIAADDERAGEATREQTVLWWRGFWQRSSIRILPGAPQPERVEWRIGRNYQLFRYQLGCNAFGKYPTKFNGGLFTFDPEFVRPEVKLDPDYRLWGGGSFTAQNQRMVYWPMLKSGDFDLMESQFLFYTRTLRNAELRTEVYWKHHGACFTEQIENFGLPVAFEYGWNRPEGLDPGVQWSRYVDRLWDTCLEFCLMILDVERFSGADISRYLPLIQSCVVFFDEHYQKEHMRERGTPLDAEGKLVFFPGSALETYKDTLNSTVTIVALEAVLGRLLALPKKYLTEVDRRYLSGYVERLPPIAFRQMRGHRVIAPAELWDRIQNVEIPQLYPVFPYTLYGVGRPNLQVAIDTWRYGVDREQQKNYVSWHQDAIFCARLGLTDEAAAITVKKMDDAPRRCPTFWGPGHDWVPDHNWGGSGMVGLQEMLLQTVEERLFLFPAWPRTWDVAFKLHAPFATTVEGRLVRGEVTDLVVTPASRRKDIVLPEWVKFSDNQAQA